MDPREKRARDAFAAFERKIHTIQQQQQNLPVDHYSRLTVGLFLKIAQSSPSVIFDTFALKYANSLKNEVKLDIKKIREKMGISENVKFDLNFLFGPFISEYGDIYIYQAGMALFELLSSLQTDQEMFDHITYNAATVLSLAKMTDPKGSLTYAHDMLFKAIDGLYNKIQTDLENINGFMSHNAQLQKLAKEDSDQADPLKDIIRLQKLINTLQEKEEEVKSNPDIVDSLLYVKSNKKIEKQPIKSEILRLYKGRIEQFIKERDQKVEAFVQSYVEQSIALTTGVMIRRDIADSKKDTKELVDSLIHRCSVHMNGCDEQVQILTSNNYIDPNLEKLKRDFVTATGKDAANLSDAEKAALELLVVAYKSLLKNRLQQEVKEFETQKASLNQIGASFLSPTGRFIKALRDKNIAQVQQMEKSENLTRAKLPGHENERREVERKRIILSKAIAEFGLGDKFTVPYGSLPKNGQELANVLTELSGNPEYANDWQRQKANQEKVVQSWSYTLGRDKTPTEFRNKVYKEMETQHAKLVAIESEKNRVIVATEATATREEDEKRKSIVQLKKYEDIFAKLQEIEDKSKRIQIDYLAFAGRVNNASAKISINDVKVLKEEKNDLDMRVANLHQEMHDWNVKFEAFKDESNVNGLTPNELEALTRVRDDLYPYDLHNSDRNCPARSVIRAIDHLEFIAEFEALHQDIDNDLAIFAKLRAENNSNDASQVNAMLAAGQARAKQLGDKLKGFKIKLDGLESNLKPEQLVYLEKTYSKLANVLNPEVGLYSQELTATALILYKNDQRGEIASDTNALLNGYLESRRARWTMWAKDIFTDKDRREREEFVDRLKNQLNAYRDKEENYQALKDLIDEGLRRFPRGYTSSSDKDKSLLGILEQLRDRTGLLPYVTLNQISIRASNSPKPSKQ